LERAGIGWEKAGIGWEGLIRVKRGLEVEKGLV